MLKRAKAGVAPQAELEQAIAKVERYKKAGATMKGVDVEERLETLDYYGDELGIAVDYLSKAASKQQAKSTYLAEGRTGKLKALTTSGQPYFKEGRGPTLEGAKHGLDTAESAALSTYTGNDFHYINPATASDKRWMATQAERNRLGGSDKDRFEDGGLHAGMMMEGMAKLPVWIGTGYRGERLTPTKFAEQYDEEGDRVTPKRVTQTKTSFWSVSVDADTARQFAESGAPGATVAVLYEITVTNACDVQGFSQSATEEEVLCPPGSKVTVTRVEKLTTGPRGEPRATAWYKVHLTQA